MTADRHQSETERPIANPQIDPNNDTKPTPNADSPRGPIVIHGVVVEPEFAEAFDMTATAIIITAIDRYWLDRAAAAMTGFGTSVIGCKIEIAIDHYLEPSQTPDRRVGVRILAFAHDHQTLDKNIAARIAQCVLTCPTAAAYAGIDPTDQARQKQIAMGKSVRYFGDGYQISKKIDGRHYWRIPVMDGEFICQHTTASTAGIGGGNFFIIAGSSASACLAAKAAVESIDQIPDVVTPFPGGTTRSGTKIGSKYGGLLASTNHAFCPTLRGMDFSLLCDDEHSVLEIVIDGLTSQAVAAAMRAGIVAACQSVGFDGGLRRISAGNYGGKLGKHHFHLHEILR